MSPDTLALFAELLGQVQIPGNHPQFDEVAARISKARRELDAAIKATLEDNPLAYVAPDGKPEAVES